MADEIITGVLAVIRSYNDFHQALRARAEVLKVSRPVLDEIAGLQHGYTSKLLSPVPTKHISRMSFGALLGAMGLKLLLVVDDEALARVQSRIDQSYSAYAGRGMPARKPEGGRGFWRGVSEWGRTMRARQLLSQSSFARSRLARKAARARWARYRAKRSGPANGGGANGSSG